MIEPEGTDLSPVLTACRGCWRRVQIEFPPLMPITQMNREGLTNIAIQSLLFQEDVVEDWGNRHQDVIHSVLATCVVPLGLTASAEHELEVRSGRVVAGGGLGLACVGVSILVNQSGDEVSHLVCVNNTGTVGRTGKLGSHYELFRTVHKMGFEVN